MPGFNAATEIRNFVSGLERDNPDLAMTARVKAAWNMICDDEVKPHITAVFVVPNTQAREVIVYVDTQIWTQELAMQSEMFRLRLNLKLQEMNQRDRMSRRSGSVVYTPNIEQVEKLRFIVSKEKYVSKDRRVNEFDIIDEEEERIKNVEPSELDPEIVAQLQQVALSIEDDTLREVAYNAAIANLAWQKGLAESQA